MKKKYFIATTKEVRDHILYSLSIYGERSQDTFNLVRFNLVLKLGDIQG